MSNAAISSSGLCKWYGRSLILNRIGLEIQPGETAVLLGPNGAGKSTLLRILAGLLKPDRGQALLCGAEAAERRGTAASVLHAPMLYGGLSARENLLLFARLNRVPNPKAALDECIGTMDIQALLDKRVDHLSNGARKRIAITRAVMARPQVLLLDEAETGLDSRSRELLMDVVKRHARSGGTVLAATHSPELYSGIAGRRIALEDGRKVEDGAA